MVNYDLRCTEHARTYTVSYFVEDVHIVWKYPPFEGKGNRLLLCPINSNPISNKSRTERGRKWREKCEKPRRAHHGPLAEFSWRENRAVSLYLLVQRTSDNMTLDNVTIGLNRQFLESLDEHNYTEHHWLI